MTPITLLVRCCRCYIGLVSGELMYQLRVISVPVTYDVNHFVVKLPSGLVFGELVLSAVGGCGSLVPDETR